MMTYRDINEARVAGRAAGAVCIIEIEHATDGRCYIVGRAQMAALAAALNHSPMPEIVRLVAEHTIRTPEEIEVERQAYLATECQCDRCHAHVDGRTAYSQQQWDHLGSQRVRVTAYYCEACREVLQSVGAGERSAMDERAAAPSREHEGKEDC